MSAVLMPSMLFIRSDTTVLTSLFISTLSLLANLHLARRSPEIRDGSTLGCDS